MMMIMTKDDLLKQYGEIIGERNDDNVLSFMENLTDTMQQFDPTEISKLQTTITELENKNTELESKNSEIENNWRKRYKSRFFGDPNVVENEDSPKPNVDTEKDKDPTQISIDDLFKKE